MSLRGSGSGATRRHEALGILALACAILSGLALWSYDLRGGENWVGPVGASVAGTLIDAFGLAACLLPLELLLVSAVLFRLRESPHALTHAAAVVVSLFLGCAFLHLLLRGTTVFGGHLPGGLLGEVTGEVLRSLLGLAGAYVVCVAAILIIVILRTTISFVDIVARVGTSANTSLADAVAKSRDSLSAVAEAWREAREVERAQRELEPGQIAEASDDETGEEEDDDEYEHEAYEEGEAEEEWVEADADEGDSVEDADDPAESSAGERKALTTASGARAKTPSAAREGAQRRRERGPVIVAPKNTAPRPIQLSLDDKRAPQGPFVLPGCELLSSAGSGTISIDAETLKRNAARLVEKLEAYGVKGRVDEIHPGPVVTMYEFEPQSGTKISKIAGLSDDLAMALAAQKVRIVAPIPGKARVGFELPNEDRQTVFLRDILEDDRWAKLNSALPVALGKDIAGQPVYGDLSKMPHVLVAGATGSGKSVGLNVMLTSLLMKKTPEQVRLLMIDPKVVELAVFDRIPHMLLPVVTDMKKASLALRWAVDEMERRYQLFADVGARNITTYNARVERVLAGDMSVEAFSPKRAGKVSARGPDGEEVLLDPVDGETPDADLWKPEKLPSVVLVVDEFADLMMVAAKDVEAAIARLAQKARAAGLHVILATQRPSVDVITGMIKANFPSRIAFKVSQREDSKTILGRIGAEHLLGLGDMLTLMPGTNDLRRVHSAYISEDEVKEVCDFLRAQGEPVYDNDILKPRDEDDNGSTGAGSTSDDPLYDRAVAVVAQAGYCSISHIQRNLSIGYNKAAKLVERMEKDGVVGPPSGKAGGRREVFVEAR
ncbi:MAG: DNA translocase FtsK 4TM domain-containing protein [Myxococcales bacterium]|nr:DNA translocase FtsK 4TM domain-containing protein [Myxococcales bacterium]